MGAQVLRPGLKLSRDLSVEPGERRRRKDDLQSLMEKSFPTARGFHPDRVALEPSPTRSEERLSLEFLEE